MSTLKTIIIDDEVQARDGIALLLEQDPEIEVLAVCKNGLEAIDKIITTSPDFIFLDIQMPEVNGFEVLNSLDGHKIPLVIFVTAYDQYALQAFELHAIDYLLKPFTNARFFHALNYAKQMIYQKSADELKDRVNLMIDQYFIKGQVDPKNYLIRDYHKNQIIYAGRLAIKSSGKIHFVDIQSIQYLEGYDAYIKIHTLNKTYVVKDSLKSMTLKLPEPFFLRIHKSYVVNTTMIRTLEPHLNGDFFLHLSSGVQLRGSRTYRKAIEDHLLK